MIIAPVLGLAILLVRMVYIEQRQMVACRSQHPSRWIHIENVLESNLHYRCGTQEQLQCHCRIYLGRLLPY